MAGSLTAIERSMNHRADRRLRSARRWSHNAQRRPDVGDTAIIFVGHAKMGERDGVVLAPRGDRPLLACARFEIGTVVRPGHLRLHRTVPAMYYPIGARSALAWINWGAGNPLPGAPGQKIELPQVNRRTSRGTSFSSTGFPRRCRRAPNDRLRGR